MALRLIEIVVPENKGDEARGLLKEENVMGLWEEDHVGATLLILKVLTSAEKTESIMDVLEKRFSSLETFRMILFPVEACVPLPPQAEEKDSSPEERDTEKKKETLRISRQELYEEVMDGTRLTRVFVAMIVLSSIVAAIGLLRDNLAVLIGAMVIAPLLGPHVALSLATTLGDAQLGRLALKTNLLGIGIALVLSICLGLVLVVNPQNPEILNRTQVAISDIVLALASGAAGTLAVTSGASTALIGVMVAVALLPPLVNFGLLVGAGKGDLAMGALLLFLTNVICVNLAGVATFLLQGIRPLTWWETNRAKRATKIAILLWVGLLLVLAIMILTSYGI